MPDMSGRSWKDERKRTAEDASKHMGNVKTRDWTRPGMSAEATFGLSAWRSALRLRESDSDSYLELENLSIRCQGSSSSGSPTRARVPMGVTGAECLVAATKVVSCNWSKGGMPGRFRPVG